MRGKRQNIQYSLALELSERGETLVGGYQGTEPPVAKPDPESPALAEQLMEEMCGRENCETAWKHVRKNKGGPGVDGMTIDEAADYLREHWPSIRSQLLDGTHQPQPVKRVEIPKPDGGVRKLGVPCVVDRLVQQAVLQVLQAQWDPTFSEHSYGFRPGRSAHQAVAQAQAYIAEGYGIVVDIDLEKFFDRVNQDRLMARVAERVSDKRVLKLIRAFLKAGVMEDGLIYPVDEGTPQGGPLSPLLSNLVLDELDKELTRRGHRFCRYADDCNIYVRSQRAGERVMASVARFLTTTLRLKVNESKSAVARPEERKFLGFSIANDGSERRIAPQALAKFKARIRDLTSPDAGNKSAPDDRNAKAIPDGLARLLRFLPDPARAHEPGSVDTPKTACVSVATVEQRSQTLQGAPPPGTLKGPSRHRRWLADGVLAHGRTCGGPAGPTQPPFRLARSPQTLHPCCGLIRSNRRGTDPYARWCGRGGIVRCPPIPIFTNAFAAPSWTL